MDFHLPTNRVFLWFTFLLLCFQLSLPVWADGQSYVLAVGGKTDYQIVVAKDAHPTEQFAATELAHYLNVVTGAKFRLRNTDNELKDGPHIVIGSDYPSLGGDGFVIRFDGQRLVISGETPRGSLYGVYYFLEKYLGCRWYSSKFSVIPKQTTVKLSLIDEREIPRFTYREVFYRDADDPLFSARLRLNGRLGHRLTQATKQEYGGHVDVRGVSAYELVSPQKYAKTHPEYFGAGQLQFANQDVRRIAIETLRKKLTTYPRKSYYLSVAQEDRGTYFNEGEDEKLITAGQSPGAAFIDFVKDIAIAIKDDYPHVTVLALAYQWSRKPPIGIVLPENMGVMMSDIEADFSKPFDAPDNLPILEDLDGWVKLTKHILVWDYVTNFGGYIQPHPNIHTLGRNLQLISRRIEVDGVFEQGVYGSRGSELAELRTWLLAKLLWNPDEDVDALIRDFVKGYYGQAAEHVEAYLELLQQSIETVSTFLTVKVPPTARFLTAGFLTTANDLFGRAEKAVETSPRHLAHVKAARMSIDYAILANYGVLQESAIDKDLAWPKYQNVYKRFKEGVKISGIKQYREGGRETRIKALLEVLEIERQAAALPLECVNQPSSDCAEVQDLGFRLAGGARIVRDKQASDGVAAMLPGGNDVWGIQLELSDLLPREGQWQIFTSVRVEARAKNPAEVVFKTGIYPGVQQVIKIADLISNEYQVLPLPGEWSYDKSRAFWAAATTSKNIKAIYIDRIYAVRQPVIEVP